jgi:hypothetical protein
VILDEAMYLPTAAIASILFILGRADNPQLWYHGVVAGSDHAA